MYAPIRLAPARAPRALAQRRLLTTTSPVRNTTLPPPPPPPAAAGAAAGTIPPGPAKRGLFRRFLVYTTIGVLVFYPVSGYISTKSEQYREFFSQLPGGEALADYADENDWEHFGPGTVTKAIARLSSSGDDLSTKLSDAKKAAEAKASELAAAARAKADVAVRKASDAKDAAASKTQELQRQASVKADEIATQAGVLAHDAKQKASSLASDAKDTAVAAKDKTVEAKDAVVKATSDAADAVADKAAKAADQVQETIDTGARAGANPYVDTQRPRQLRPETVVPEKPSFEGKTVYPEAVPLGFEPPPGFYVPPPPKPKTPAEAEKLPLLVPQVKEFAAQEPIISQLASTIDSLTNSLSSAKGGPSAEASNILNRAEKDLQSLNSRLDEIKKAEKQRLEKTVAEQTAAFEAKLDEKKAEWQKDEAGLKESWEAERQKMIDGWRQVLDAELEGQRQGIESRLREEVVSQGIELQRRWLRSIKSQVETERGGRLAKLDSLTTSLKQLERITLDNSAALDDNVRLHKIWSALRAVQTKADNGDVAFDDELRVLQALAQPGDAGVADDAVVNATLKQLEASGIPQTGVKSFTALSSWFTNSVAPRIHEASLVPAPEDATVASHVASQVLSKLLFRPKAGLVDGNDVGAVLARAEYALGEKDLDAATREVNSLRGWPRKLAEDWLREARRKLEVQQALDVVNAEATLSSLLLV